MRPLLLALLALVVACFAPSQHDPARFRTQGIALGAPLDDADPWFGDERKELAAEVPLLDAWGPTFVLVPEGTPGSITWRPFDSTAADPQHRKCGAGACRYFPGADFIECDPACCAGFDELRAGAGHDTGHAMGLAHVCQRGEASDSCDPRAGYGDAMMNLDVSYEVQDESSATAGVVVSQLRPTALDIREFNACGAAQRLAVGASGGAGAPQAFRARGARPETLYSRRIHPTRRVSSP
jgi:hypothetical protein